MVEAPVIRVRLAEGAESGLASIVQQYLEQDLEECVAKRRQASRLRGRLAMTAADHETTVTLEFRGMEIAIWDGERPPLDGSIVGPYLALTRLLQGRASPLMEHLRGRLRVRSSLRRPLFPFRVHRLMRLPSEERSRTQAYLVTAAVAGLLIAAGAAAALWAT